MEPESKEPVKRWREPVAVLPDEEEEEDPGWRPTQDMLAPVEPVTTRQLFPLHTSRLRDTYNPVTVRLCVWDMHKYLEAGDRKPLHPFTVAWTLYRRLYQALQDTEKEDDLNVNWETEEIACTAAHDQLEAALAEDDHDVEPHPYVHLRLQQRYVRGLETLGVDIMKRRERRRREHPEVVEARAQKPTSDLEALNRALQALGMRDASSPWEQADHKQEIARVLDLPAVPEHVPRAGLAPAASSSSSSAAVATDPLDTDVEMGGT